LIVELLVVKLFVEREFEERVPVTVCDPTVVLEPCETKPDPNVDGPVTDNEPRRAEPMFEELKLADVAVANASDAPTEVLVPVVLVLAKDPYVLESPVVVIVAVLTKLVKLALVDSMLSPELRADRVAVLLTTRELKTPKLLESPVDETVPVVVCEPEVTLPKTPTPDTFRFESCAKDDESPFVVVVELTSRLFKVPKLLEKPDDDTVPEIVAEPDESTDDDRLLIVEVPNVEVAPDSIPLNVDPLLNVIGADTVVVPLMNESPCSVVVPVTVRDGTASVPMLRVPKVAVPA
jgi:hypothetical protein